MAQTPTKRQRSLRSSWVRSNGMMALALALGFGFDSEFGKGMAFGFAWVGGVVMGLTLIRSVAAAVVEDLANKGPPVPAWLAVAFDVAAACVMAHGGYPLTATVIVLTLMRGMMLRRAIVALQDTRVLVA